MGKKIDDAEVKKECPSCGLGVALDSTICEFCGWDFEEEDEWILQIEKLERELMLEKQRFEPGTVDHKIESTLHAPHAERVDKSNATAEEKAVPETPTRQEPQTRQVKQQKVAAPVPAEAPPTKPAPTRTVVTPKPAPPPVSPAPAVRKVKTPEAEEKAEAAPKTRKVRVVRKVKQ